MTNTILPLSLTNASAAVPPRAYKLGRGAEAARQFETQLIGSVLESLQKIFAAVPGEDSTPGADEYNYLGTQALAGGIVAAGGFGIAAMLSRYLEEGKTG